MSDVRGRTPTVPRSPERSLRIACDESGYEGEKLIRGTTEVFAHAGVRLGFAESTELIRELRDRIRSPATEYKANHLLRAKHRPVLEWLLSPAGPVHGRGNVCLVDKSFFVVAKTVDLLVERRPPTAANGLRHDRSAQRAAIALYGAGRRLADAPRWRAFLETANDLLRMKDRFDVTTSVDSFFHMVEVLRTEPALRNVKSILDALGRGRPHAESFRERLLDGSVGIPAIDPLLPSIVQTAEHFGANGRPLAIVHDRQNMLSPDRVAHLTAILDGSPARLSGFRLVESFTSPQVQIADMLAGVARKIVTDELEGHGDARLTGLLRPYVDAQSYWGDDPSWARVRPE